MADANDYRTPETLSHLGPFHVEQIGSRTKLFGPHGHYRWLEPDGPFDRHRALLEEYEAWWGFIRLPRVYFVGAELKLGLPIKVGIAGNPRERLRSLQTSHPKPLTLFALEYGGREREAELHQRWRRQRLNGEWFTLTAPILDHVAKLTPSLTTRLAEVQARPVGRSNDSAVVDATFGVDDER